MILDVVGTTDHGLDDANEVPKTMEQYNVSLLMFLHNFSLSIFFPMKTYGRAAR
jgi:hypothetical protein